MKKLTFDEIEVNRLTADKARSTPRLPLTVVLDNVRSLYNVGSIFRTADAVLLAELVLTGFTPRPPRREIAKTALGATETVPWRYVHSPRDAVKALKQEGHTIAALELTAGSVPLHEFHPPRSPLALVLGNEVTGINEDLLGLCDTAIAIPMHGTKHSLNVAVAFGVAAYHFERIWSPVSRRRV